VITEQTSVLAPRKFKRIPQVVYKKREEEEETTCPTATLISDSIAVAKNKCGFRAPLLDCAGSVRARPTPDRVYHTRSWNCAGAIIGSETDTSCPFARFYLTDFCAFLGVSPICNCVITDTSIDYDNCPPATLGHYHTDISSEYTTADLRTNTIAALPAYSGTFGCHPGYLTGQGCDFSSFANLSVDEINYTIRRFKHKFLLSSP